MLGGIGKMRPCGHHHYYKYAHAKNRNDLLAVHNSSSTYKNDEMDGIWGPFSLESLESLASCFSSSTTIKKWIGYVPNITSLSQSFYDSTVEEVDFQGIQPEKITSAYDVFRGALKLRVLPESFGEYPAKSYSRAIASAQRLLFDDSEDGIQTLPYKENLDNAENLAQFASWMKYSTWTWWKFDDRYSFENVTNVNYLGEHWSYLYKFPNNLSFKNLINGAGFVNTNPMFTDVYTTHNDFAFAPKDIMTELKDGDKMFSTHACLTQFYPNFESYSLPNLTTAVDMFYDCSLDAESIIKFCNALPKWTSGTHKVTIGANPDVKYDPYVNLALKQIDINFEPFTELPIDENTGLPIEVTEGKGWTLTLSFPRNFASYCSFYRSSSTEKEVLPPDLVESIKGGDEELPPNYTRCLYLKSDGGGQYIDTGYVPSENTGLYIAAKNVRYLSDMSRPQCLSNWYGSTPRMSCPVVLAARINPIYYWNSAYKDCSYTNYSIWGRSFESWLNWLNSNEVKSVCDDLIYTSTLGTWTSSKTFNNNLQLFRGKNNDSYYEWHGRVYRAKISEGDTIVRDFIPCLDENGVPCMYDIINHQPYYNEQENDFTFDSENVTVDESVVLPENYTRLDYLETIGYNVIDTGVKPNHETGMSVTYQLSNGILSRPISGTIGVGINSPNGGWTNSLGCFEPPYVASSNTTTVRFMNTLAGVKVTNGTTTNISLPFTFNTTTKYTSTLNFYNDKKAYINDTLVKEIPENLPRNPKTRNIYLFGRNRGDYYWRNESFSGRIYRAQITQGSELIRDFIPCLDPNGKPCMYDIVNDKPYYSINQGFKYKLATEL